MSEIVQFPGAPVSTTNTTANPVTRVSAETSNPGSESPLLQLAEPLTEGTRNDVLFRCSRALAAYGVPKESARSLLLNAAARSRPEFPHGEFNKLIDHAYEDYRSDQMDLVEPPHPVLDPRALQGLAGEIVKAITPYTEVSAAALLVSLLTVVGNIVGRNRYTVAESVRHHANLFAALVGDTSKARKSSAIANIKNVVRVTESNPAISFQALDAITSHMPRSGLSTPEGIIYHVRDTEEDETSTDKRLLAIETEFAVVLSRARRDGNALTPVLRQAWDGEDLRTLTRNQPLVASAPHVSVLAAITRDELEHLLGSTDMTNGLANRVLWIHTERERLIPESEPIPDDVLMPLTVMLGEVIDIATSSERHLRRDSEARADWLHIYEMLSKPVPGKVGAAVNRAEAQVLRLSLVYAIFDGADEIRRVHQDAALALWQYAEASARYIFGTLSEDALHIASILETADEDGLSSSGITDALGRNWKARRKLAALHELEALALAVRSIVESDGGGRPSEIWRRVNPTK